MSSPFQGEVVSLTANTVSVKVASTSQSKAALVNITIPADAKIVRGGKACSIKDIQKGDSVSVAFASKPGCAGPSVTQVEICKSASR
jgi:hypothetical protein